MPAKCDIQKQVVVKDGSGKKALIVDERFIRCTNDRVVILDTSKGRMGFCRGHLEQYNELMTDVKKGGSKGRKAQADWLRYRHGMVVAGEPEVEVQEAS